MRDLLVSGASRGSRHTAQMRVSWRILGRPGGALKRAGERFDAGMGGPCAASHCVTSGRFGRLRGSALLVRSVVSAGFRRTCPGARFERSCRFGPVSADRPPGAFSAKLPFSPDRPPGVFWAKLLFSARFRVRLPALGLVALPQKEVICILSRLWGSIYKLRLLLRKAFKAPGGAFSRHCQQVPRER